MPLDEEIQKQYSVDLWSHRYPPEKALLTVISEGAKASEKLKQEIPCQLGISYGLNQREKLDIFGADKVPADAPILVIIHGGGWIMGRREDTSFVVPPFIDAGMLCIVPGYSLAPKATLDDIVADVCRAIAHVIDMAKSRGSRGIYVAGHSAGAHLAAMAASSPLMTNPDLAKWIKGFVLVSGVFDMHPIMKTTWAELGNFTEDAVQRNSPMFLVEEVSRHLQHCRFLVAVSQYDSPEFHRQSKEYHEQLLSVNLSSKYVEIPDSDHLTICLDLCIPEFTMTKEIINFVNES
ncbi:kynurenine formamidase-like [Limulus polyphemus]|uniref:Kynurenine formamidase-like n=1 Tax=Limulus polyphemus TaxID=6850 RepID=A0ABM1T6S3_LIMPO|nr:kynurenine formamidase-like [Limulus polyphemus]XP_022251579.1 kynurenine formamidase-like [Limulus polyphemus]